MQPGTISAELEQMVLENSDYVAALEEVFAKAKRVVSNAFGTKPKHTRASPLRPTQTGCRDDCIPCGLAALGLSLQDAELLR